MTTIRLLLVALLILASPALPGLLRAWATEGQIAAGLLLALYGLASYLASSGQKGGEDEGYEQEYGHLN